MMRLQNWESDTPIKYKWHLIRWDRNMLCAEPKVLDGEGTISKGDKIAIINDRLYINGKHTLHIRFDDGNNPPKYDVRAEFNVIDRDIFVTSWLIGLIGAGLGAGLTLLVQSLAKILD